MHPHSPISKIVLDNREFLIKRDDLIDPYLAGNKYRKLHTLVYTPSSNINKVISYGGTQSNAMLAIASLCKTKEWEFVYYTKPLSSQQKQNPSGNYALSLKFGMQHKEVEYELYRDFINSLRLNLEEKTIIIDQGGADVMAQKGLEVLAKEIREANLNIDAIATPSGTGTTALFLAKNLPEYKVYTTPSIGDKTYLEEQMKALSALPSNLYILQPSKKYRFAKPYDEFFNIYNKLLDAGVEFDLLYAPALWLTLLEQTNEKILYVHSGGVSGNESMLSRYNARLKH